MTYIRKTDYSQERERPGLFTNYLQKMTLYLKTLHPERSAEEIEAFIKDIVRKRAKSPMVQAVHHKREGYSEDIEMRLDKFIVQIIGKNNLSPSGSCYLPVEVKESFLRRSIEAKIKARNEFKHMYLGFEAQGKKREAQYYYQKQANAKIFNNAIAGGMRIKQFILGSLAGFNAITSTGRMSVKQGYSFIERAVNGNIYLPSSADAISYILNHASHVPEEFAALIQQDILYVPTTQQVTDYLVTSVENYVQRPNAAWIQSLLTGLDDTKLAYVFYAGCLSNLCRYNETMMRGWIDSCFISEKIDPVLYQDIDPAEVKSFPGDVISCILSTNYKRLGENPKKPGKWNSLKDAAKFNPEGLKEFIYVCRHFQENFQKLLHVIRPIFQIQTTFSRLTHQNRMARYTVPLSDTDSNIFSTQELIRWKRGKLDFHQESYEMNAMVTFILSQSLEHVFARLSSGLGIAQKDVFRISMKNEFLYPILLSTSLAKHYLAIATMQEGSLLPNPRKDIKGVGYRSSAYPKLIRDGFDKFVVDLFAEIEKGEPIEAASILSHIAGIEHTINQSILDRESVYLQTVSVKRKEDYADPMGSSYFYYELWSSVFAEEYGEMVIPNKCYKIPLKNGKRLFRDPVFLSHLEQTHPVIHKNLMRFMANYPKRDITYLLIPPFKGNIQPFFTEIMDVRAHISQVMMAYYHTLDGLGIGTVDKRANGLVSDFYNPAQLAVT